MEDHGTTTPNDTQGDTLDAAEKRRRLGGDYLRLEDWNRGSLERLRKRIDDRLRAMALDEIRDLEDRANQIRAQVGLRLRPRLRKERPIPR